MPTFTTAFTPPPPIEGLTATAIGGAAIVLEWSPSTLSPEDFVAYIVARSLTGGDDFVEVATIPDQATTTWADYAAPLDRPVYYRVSQANLDFVSDPVEVVTALEGCAWWLVTPGAPDASFELPNVTAYEGEFPMQQVEHEPLGRPLKLVESGELLGEQGNLTAHLLPIHDPQVLALLRAAASGSSTSVLLKTPYGEVFSVAIGTIRRVRLTGGRQEVSFRYVAV